MDIKSIYKLDHSDSLIEAFELLRKSIFYDLHVGTLAFYNSTVKEYSDEDKFGIISVRPFPIKKDETSYTINCYVLDDRVFEPGQIIGIMFMDLMFIDNLQTDLITPRKVKNDTMHSQMSGIVITPNPISIKESGEHIVLTYNGKSYNLQLAEENDI